MQIFFELPEETILDLAAQIQGRTEEVQEQRYQQSLKNEIHRLTKDKPVTQGDIDNAISKRTRGAS